MSTPPLNSTGYILSPWEVQGVQQIVDEMIRLGYLATPGGAAVGEQTVTQAAFDAMVTAGTLIPGVQYFIEAAPARWMAKTGSTVDGIGFLSGGIFYFGDVSFASQDQIDLVSGTFAARQLSGFTPGILYHQQMSDIGDMPGGAHMVFLGGVSTEWHIVNQEDVFNDYTVVTGASNTNEQALNPKDLPAGILNTCGEFEIIIVGGSSGTTDAGTSIKARLGAAGTTADQVLNGVQSAAWVAGDKGRPTRFRYRVTSTALITAVDSANANTGYPGSATTVAANYFPTYAVAAANALKLSANIKLTSAAADSPQCTRICLRMYP